MSLLAVMSWQYQNRGWRSSLRVSIVDDLVHEEAEDHRALAGLGEHGAETLRDVLGAVVGAGVLDGDGQQRLDGGAAIARRRIARPGGHAEAAEFLADELGDELELGVGELPRIDVAEQHHVIGQHLRHALGETRDRAGAFLGEAGVSGEEQAAHLEAFLVADQLILEVAVIPARVAVAIEHGDSGIEDFDLLGEIVVLFIDLAGLFDDLGDDGERALVRGPEVHLHFLHASVGERHGALGRLAVAGLEGACRWPGP